jgi:RHS repeat-associated protein
LTTNQQSGTFSEQNSLPFGTALASETTPNNNTKKFTSYERSARTGLDYAINRTYDSKLGRFTQVDPITMDSVSLAAPQTLNLYSYCGNDPINHTDPDGLFWGSFFKWFSKAFKWISIAVTVAFIVLSVAASHGTLSPFFAKMLGILTKIIGFKKATDWNIIYNFAGDFVGLTIVQSISIGLSGQIIAGINAVGAISNFSKPKKKANKKKTDQEILEAARIAIIARLSNETCRKYVLGDLGAVVYNSKEKLTKNIKVAYDAKLPAGIAGQSTVGAGLNSTIRIGNSGIRNSGTYGGWRFSKNSGTKLQAVILHELRHTTGGVNHPFDANGKEVMTGTDSNQDFFDNISKKCF